MSADVRDRRSEIGDRRSDRRPPTSDLRSPSSRSGQAVVFLLLAFTALIFVLLFNVDLHRIIQRKNQTQNAGDAAALAAARWQGATINLVGELNLFHVLALASQSPAAVEAITNMQARLCFTGPMTALYAAQIAAKANHIYADPDMTALLTEHAATVRSQYTLLFDNEMRFPEPWPGAWPEYADMIERVAAEGVSAGPDNTRFFTDPAAGHMLFNKAFYGAIIGRNWCWFFFNERPLLADYDDFHSWPALPETDPANYADSEIFGVGLHPYITRISSRFSPDALARHITDAGLGPITAAALDTNTVMDSFEAWYFYDTREWTSWTRISPDGDDNFPITGPVRAEYDYAGADAIVRVYAGVDRLTPDLAGGSSSNTIPWTSAAKPFGYLETDTGKQRPDSAASFVLPAFRDVRLIPIDSASGSENSSSDIEWVRHIKNHLEAYMIEGPQPSECRYCRALAIWEIKAFRDEGIAWLEINSGSCTIITGGGGRGGGSRRGH